MSMDFIAVALSLEPHMQLHARVDEWFGGFVAVQEYESIHLKWSTLLAHLYISEKQNFKKNLQKI